MDLLGVYSNQPWVHARLVHLVSLPSREDRGEQTRPPRQRQRRLSDEQQGELAERYRAGESVYKLAAGFKITRQTVSSILERRDVPRRFRILSGARIDEARELYERGHSLADVGEQMGVSAHTVLNVFAKARIPTRPVGTNQWLAR